MFAVNLLLFAVVCAWTLGFGFLCWLIIRTLRRSPNQDAVVRLVLGAALLVCGLFTLLGTACGTMGVYSLLTSGFNH